MTLNQKLTRILACWWCSNLTLSQKRKGSQQKVQLQEEKHNCEKELYSVLQKDSYPFVNFVSKPNFLLLPTKQSQVAQDKRSPFIGSITMLYTFFHNLHNLFTVNYSCAYYCMSVFTLSHSFCISEEFTIEEYSVPCSAGKVQTVKSDANEKKINKHLLFE